MCACLRAVRQAAALDNLGRTPTRYATQEKPRAAAQPVPFPCQPITATSVGQNHVPCQSNVSRVSQDVNIRKNLM